jgi:diguanylate cyclase (GGDEF)-like protein
MMYDAARRLSRPDKSAADPVRRQRPASLENLLKAALESALPGLILLDTARRVRLVTGGAASMLGLPEAGPTPGTPIMRLLAKSLWLDQPCLLALAAAFKPGDAAAPRKIMLTVPHPAGTRILAVDIRPARQEGFAVSLTDVTQSKQTQDFLLDQASRDPVTGLWNRQHFMLMLRDKLDGPQQAGIAVLMLDLKRFRQVIESQGTEAGDMLLLLVGKRLSTFLRDDDLLARFTSDEFAIMVTGMQDHAALANLSARIAEGLARPFLIEGQLITTGAYMGAAGAPHDGDRPEALVANAGLALAAARAEARGQLRFFEPRLNERARHRRKLEGDLRLALAHGEFEVHYQPQINMRTSRADGCEALLRWRCRQRGLVSPAEFIPIAEEIGLIGELGNWVLRQACREACAWPEEITVAVNASPLQMEAPDFAASVAHVLAQTGLPGRRLEIEITENLLLHNGPAVVGTLSDLRALGVRLVLDDFGTGYASLSQLARFPFDRIKIDRGFISGPDLTEGHAVIVRAIAALGISLGVPTTAEGVETEAQLDQVREAGCSSVQGYYFSRPLQAGALPAFFARRHMPHEAALAETAQA